MKKSNKNKLDTIKTETVVHLSSQEMKDIKGGFLSIVLCTKNHTTRGKCGLWTKCWGDTNGNLPGGECGHDILNS